MKILYDTSVLVAVAIADHPRHEVCNRFFNEGRSGHHDILVCSHSIAELYSSLTRMPVKPMISPGSARQIIKKNCLEGTRIVELHEDDYSKALDLALDLNLSGGMIYDVLLFVAARQAKADRIATLNVRHFSRICPDESAMLQTF